MFKTGHKIVDDIGKVGVFGNCVPQQWFGRVTKASGATDPLAILILSDVVSWYRPQLIRDEKTGAIIGAKKRFQGEMLCRSCNTWGKHLGVSRDKAWRAIKRLRELGLVRTKTACAKPGQRGYLAVLYVEPVPKAIEIITNCKTVGYDDSGHSREWVSDNNIFSRRTKATFSNSYSDQPYLEDKVLIPASPFSEPDSAGERNSRPSKTENKESAAKSTSSDSEVPSNQLVPRFHGVKFVPRDVAFVAAAYDRERKSFGLGPEKWGPRDVYMLRAFIQRCRGPVNAMKLITYVHNNFNCLHRSWKLPDTTTAPNMKIIVHYGMSVFPDIVRASSPAANIPNVLDLSRGGRKTVDITRGSVIIMHGTKIMQKPKKLAQKLNPFVPIVSRIVDGEKRRSKNDRNSKREVTMAKTNRMTEGVEATEATNNRIIKYVEEYYYGRNPRNIRIADDDVTCHIDGPQDGKLFRIWMGTVADVLAEIDSKNKGRP